MASPRPKLSAELGALCPSRFVFAPRGPREGVLSPKPATALHALGGKLNGRLVCRLRKLRYCRALPLVPASPIPSPSQSPFLTSRISDFHARTRSLQPHCQVPSLLLPNQTLLPCPCLPPPPHRASTGLSVAAEPEAVAALASQPPSRQP
jgi:hypothetical protein